MKKAALFFGVLAIAAALAWVGGYDFDTRSPSVAWAAFIAIVTATIVAIIP